MRIGIITFQLAWNCGAVLQCYALQTYMERLGYDVVIINYRPKYKAYRYKKYCNPFISVYKEYKAGNGYKGLIRCGKKFIRTILNYKRGSEHLRQWKGFDEFCQSNLNLTREYDSIKALKHCPPDCDIYISGSDQLWNPKLTGDALDSAYFLEFGNSKITRVAYAISACQLDFNQYGAEFARLCRGLDYISLRERTIAAQLRQWMGNDLSIVPDPVFLINSRDFEKLESNAFSQEEYILVYFLESSEKNTWIFECIKKLSESTGVKVKVLSGPRRWHYPVEQIRGVIPCEFLAGIKHARYVISNSFHATAFSVIYRKNFVAVDFKGRGERMQELLSNIGLEDRMVSNTDNFHDVILKEIDYDECELYVKRLSEKGKHFLDKVIKEVQCNDN